MGAYSKTFDDVLEEIRKEAKNKKELGMKFESLIVNFFKKDKTYQNRFSKVWWFADWPGKNRRDTGIDIVAQERDGGEYVGIQCKCYDNDNPVDYEGVSKLLTACKSYKITRYILAYTSDKLTPESRRMCKENNILLLNKSDLRSSSINNWSKHFDKISVNEPKILRPDQDKVCKDVVDGFKLHKRGKMLMACGTGKTLTALRIAENLKCKTVLYLVPSISLIQQSMREWSDNAQEKYQYIAVCSDKSAGRDESGQIYELERLPSTDSNSFIAQFENRKNYTMTVIFSTYQSIDIIAKGLKISEKHTIDLILCDEAHRTATKPNKAKKKERDNDDAQQFTKVHDDNIICGKRRLYMTATPRIYDGDSVTGIYSMDNEDVFGPTFSTISFYEAVHGDMPVLSDFKVKIAILPQDRLPEYLGIMDHLVDPSTDKDKKREAKLLEHKAKYAAAWHGILKPDDEPLRNKPLQKLIVFTNTIEKSEVFAGINKKKEHGSFAAIAREYNDYYNIKHRIDVRHIDGKMHSDQRRMGLDWLDDSGNDIMETRVISNAKCLSEGVDVPTLDGVIFMEPKKSTVDVVQSVGRVMRMAVNKDYGYVILPVVVPGGETAKDILDNSKFRHVWQVINALRSHDPRLIAELSSAGLVPEPSPEEGTGTARITVDFLGVDPEKEKSLYSDLTLAMRSKLVKKVGTVDYVQKYGAKLGSYARKVRDVINKMDSEKNISDKLDHFHIHMQDLINTDVTRDDSIKMISQHVILKYVFDLLFTEDFASQNPVSKKLDSILSSMNLGSVLAELGGFYEDVKRETDVIKNSPETEMYERREHFIRKIYGSFISNAEKKTAIEKGIVYTPSELADFILYSVQHILKTHMGNKTLNSKDVQILEPFVGTGTFLTRMINLGLIDKTLENKYSEGAYANEVVLLAYYIAAVNIETTYAQKMKQCGKNFKYSQFKNINYTDTFKHNPNERSVGSTGLIKHMDDKYIETLREQIAHQNRQCIEVIIGNPPWGIAKKSHISHKHKHKPPYDVQLRINETYGKRTKVGKNKLHELYVRALRWSTDRLGEYGIIAFVLNGSLLKNRSFAGIRASLEEEFEEIWCFDLRGNQNTKGKVSEREGGKIFGSGSKSPVTIIILIKNPNKKNCKIYYKDIGDYLTREEKLKIIKESKSIRGVKNWQIIIPDKHYNWINPTSDEILKYAPICKASMDKSNIPHIFDYYKNGVVTNQDEWAYNKSKERLAKNMKQQIGYLNKNMSDKNLQHDYDHEKGKWTRDTINRLIKHGKQTFDSKKIRPALYRPFFTQYLYFDWVFNAVWNVNEIMPNGSSKNEIMLVSWGGDLHTLMTNLTPDIHVIGDNKCFPLYRYEKKKKICNITDDIWEEYKIHYNDNTIKKTDIFYYVYGLLHHPGYRKEFKNELIQNLPRVPMAPNFKKFSNLGQKLANLHVKFDNIKTCGEVNNIKLLSKIIEKPHSIKFITNTKIDSVEQKHSESSLAINGKIIYDDLPKVYYRLNGRTPLGWFVERCDKYAKPYNDSGLTNNVFEHMSSDDIIKKIKQLLYIGLETDRLIKQLPVEFKPKNFVREKSNMSNEYQLIDKTPKRAKR